MVGVVLAAGIAGVGFTVRIFVAGYAAKARDVVVDDITD